MLSGLRRRSLEYGGSQFIGVLRSHQNTKPSACTASVEPPLTVPCTRARRAAANLDCRHTLIRANPWPGNAGSIVERTRHFARISPQFARLLAQVCPAERARIRSLPSPAGRWPLPKSKALFVCTACGATAAQWQGQCASCGEWNSLQSAPAPLRDGRRRTAPAGSGSAELQSLAALDRDSRSSTGIEELDRVLGGGLVKELSGAARGRSWYRQVDTAAAGCGCARSQPSCAVCNRRRIAAAGGTACPASGPGGTEAASDRGDLGWSASSKKARSRTPRS